MTMNRQEFVNGATAAIALSLVVGCGGGGGSSSSSSSSSSGGGADDPITITSGSAATVSENTSGTVYTITANGGSGNYTFSIAGDDAGLFVVNANGEVSFLVAPDFDQPNDANGDNVYNITVDATDTSPREYMFRQMMQDVSISVTDMPTSLSESQLI
ncbi:MAG: hypothetical protein AAF420_14870 [Pseudomonadota bacterium]